MTDRERLINLYWRDGLLLLLPEDEELRRALLGRLCAELERGRGYERQELVFRILDHYDDYETVLEALLALELIKKEGKLYYVC